MFLLLDEFPIKQFFYNSDFIYVNYTMHTTSRIMIVNDGWYLTY